MAKGACCVDTLYAHSAGSQRAGTLGCVCLPRALARLSMPSGVCAHPDLPPDKFSEPEMKHGMRNGA